MLCFTWNKRFSCEHNPASNYISYKTPLFAVVLLKQFPSKKETAGLDKETYGGDAGRRNGV